MKNSAQAIPKETLPKTREVIADIAGVSHDTIAKVKVIEAKAPPVGLSRPFVSFFVAVRRAHIDNQAGDNWLLLRYSRRYPSVTEFQEFRLLLRLAVRHSAKYPLDARHAANVLSAYLLCQGLQGGKRLRPARPIDPAIAFLERLQVAIIHS